jgi:hypothetical protein
MLLPDLFPPGNTVFWNGHIKVCTPTARVPSSLKISELDIDDRLAIARAFGEEPLERAVVDVGDKLVYLANPDLLSLVNSGESSQSGSPRRHIYL